jgi:hypothetical protein
MEDEGLLVSSGLDLSRINGFSVEDVESWFSTLKLTTTYAKVLKNNGIDGQALVSFTEYDKKFIVAELKALDIKVGDALKIASALEKIVRISGGEQRLPPVETTIVNPLVQHSFLKHQNDAVKPQSFLKQQNDAVKPVSRTDGFQRSRLESLPDDSNVHVYSNPALGFELEEDTSTKRISSTPLPMPRWSIAARGGQTIDIPEKTPTGCWQELLATMRAWHQHGKLLAIVLVFMAYFEVLKWLYNGNLSSAFLFFAMVPRAFLEPLLIVGTAQIASSDYLSVPYAKKLIAIGVVGQIFVCFLSFGCGRLKNPFITQLYSVQSVGYGLYWGVLWMIYPNVIFYLYRGAFRWKETTGMLCLLLVVWFGRQSTIVLAGIIFELHRRYDQFLHYFYMVTYILLLALIFYSSVIESCRAKQIRGSGPHLMFLVLLTFWFPMMCGGLMLALVKWFGHSDTALVGVLMVWSLFLVAVYLNCRLVATRSMPYTKVPILVLSLQITGDLFTEMVFMDFSLTSWQFWVSIDRSQVHKLMYTSNTATDLCTSLSTLGFYPL